MKITPMKQLFALALLTVCSARADITILGSVADLKWTSTAGYSVGSFSTNAPVTLTCRVVDANDATNVHAGNVSAGNYSQSFTTNVTVTACQFTINFGIYSTTY